MKGQPCLYDTYLAPNFELYVFRSISDDVILESPDKHSSSSDQFYDVPESPRLATSAEDGEKKLELQPGISNSQELVRDTLPPGKNII